LGTQPYTRVPGYVTFELFLKGMVGHRFIDLALLFVFEVIVPTHI